MNVVLIWDYSETICSIKRFLVKGRSKRCILYEDFLLEVWPSGCLL